MQGIHGREARGLPLRPPRRHLDNAEEAVQGRHVDGRERMRPRRPRDDPSGPQEGAGLLGGARRGRKRLGGAPEGHTGTGMQERQALRDGQTERHAGGRREGLPRRQASEVPRPRPPKHDGQGAQEGQVRDRGGLQGRLRRRQDQGGGDVEAEGLRREVVQDLPFPDGIPDDAEPVHVLRLPLGDAQVDLHLERDRVVQL